MSQLTQLLERAFENKGNKNHYVSGPWSIGFNKRVFDTYFELYYSRNGSRVDSVPVLSGNTLDKELSFCNSEFVSKDLITEIEKALPDYRFKIHLSVIMPVDFDGDWTQEIENAEYAGTVEEYRPEDLVDGNYGYDVVLFSVPRLADIQSVFVHEEGMPTCYAKSYVLGVGLNGFIEVHPTSWAPVEERGASFDANSLDALCDWNEVASKSVKDADGFNTDYTWYTNGTNHIFIFGDKELYGPSDSSPDWECCNENEAKEWFDNYKGFEEAENLECIPLDEQIHFAEGISASQQSVSSAPVKEER